MPLILPPSTPSGIHRYEWVDPSGTLRDLTLSTSPRLFVSRGAAGLGHVEPQLTTEKFPASSGSHLRTIRIPERQITLPITIIEDSFGDLIDVVDGLRTWFNTGDERGGTPGYLRITRPDGTVRQIACYYAGGLGGDLSQGGPQTTTYAVSLLAPDPYPTDQDDTTLTYDQAEYGAGIEQIVINQGEIDAYPTWLIDGPVTGVTLYRRVAGLVVETLALSADGGVSLTSAQYLYINTQRAGRRQTFVVVRNDGQTLSSTLSAASSLWYFRPGENRFAIDITGATADTLVTLAYRAAYLGLVR